MFIKIVVQYIERTISQDYWVTPLLVGVFVLLASMRWVFYDRFNRWVSLSYLTLTTPKKEKRDGVFLLLLFVFQVLVFTFFVYLFYVKTHPNNEQNRWFFVQVLTLITVFLVIKKVFERIIGVVFSVEPIVNYIQYKKNLSTAFIAILIYIFSVLFYFAGNFNSSLWFTITLSSVVLYVLLVGFGYKSYKSILLGNLFYFILYLCALEIAPVLIILKLIVR